MCWHTQDYEWSIRTSFINPSTVLIICLEKKTLYDKCESIWLREMQDRNCEKENRRDRKLHIKHWLNFDVYIMPNCFTQWSTYSNKIQRHLLVWNWIVCVLRILGSTYSMMKFSILNLDFLFLYWFKYLPWG